ncbi:MAG: hypothetical protein KJ646_00810 [Nanoarchaeota archaeon]|nr:hypothetical protein [Nanoarchaeota archaeon]
MVKGIEFEKWVEVSIGVSVSSDGLLNLKKFMKKIAEELEWVLEVDKKGYVNEKGSRLYPISIKPKNKFMSPEELRQKIDLLEGFSIHILKALDMISEENPPSYTIELISDDKVGVTFGGILGMVSKISDFAKLEKNHPNLCKVIFKITLEDYKTDLIKKRDSAKFWFRKKENPKKEALDIVINLIEKGYKNG